MPYDTKVGRYIEWTQLSLQYKRRPWWDIWLSKDRLKPECKCPICLAFGIVLVTGMFQLVCKRLHNPSKQHHIVAKQYESYSVQRDEETE